MELKFSFNSRVAEVSFPVLTVKFDRLQVNDQTLLKFSTFFLNYGDGYLTLLMSQRVMSKYNWVSQVAESYFPGYFSLVNFSGRKSVILHVKLYALRQIIQFFKYNWCFRFNMLIDLFANDYIARANRFELTYCLLSLKRAERLYLRVFANELTIIPSVSGFYKSANWLEREVWDMYGVAFAGHPDLRRILTDYGFLGHPLRKDFPLTGFFEVRYDDTSRRIVSEAVNLTQELRLFFFSTSWRAL